MPWSVGFRRETPRLKRSPMKGKRFGMWVVVAEFSSSYVDCRCDCGVERSVQVGALRCGHSKSCGHTWGKKKPPRTKEHNAKISEGKKRYHDRQKQQAERLAAKAEYMRLWRAGKTSKRWSQEHRAKLSCAAKAKYARMRG